MNNLLRRVLAEATLNVGTSIKNKIDVNNSDMAAAKEIRIASQLSTPANTNARHPEFLKVFSFA